MNPPQKNRRNKFLLLTAFMLVSIFFLTSCSSSKEKQKTQQEKIPGEKIIISYSPWPGNIGLLIARDKGYFTEEGLDVELKNYAGLQQASEDYQKGLIQARGNLNLDATKETLAGLDHKIVLVLDYSNGADGIIAKKEIKDMSEVKGKKVAYEFGTLEEFFLRHALEEVNLNLNDIEGINLDPEKAATAFVAGDVDVAVTWEPFVSSALGKTDSHKIYSSTNAPGLIMDVVTFRNDFIEKNPEAMHAFIRAYFKAIKFLESKPEDAYRIAANDSNISPEEIAKQIKGIKIAGEKENRTAFSYTAGVDSLYGNLHKVIEFLNADEKIRPEDLINPVFIKSI